MNQTLESTAASPVGCALIFHIDSNKRLAWAAWLLKAHREKSRYTQKRNLGSCQKIIPKTKYVLHDINTKWGMLECLQ